MSQSPTQKYWILGFAIVLMFVKVETYAQESINDSLDTDTTELQVDEIIVEGSIIADTVENIPQNVSVITETDIEQSSSRNLGSILAEQAGVSLRSYTGSDKFNRIDIRGMGDTAVSNVITVTDGIRMTPADMSGSDFSTIDLDQIEKIEILRGAGSVVYGDGAVGGVVNITTKKSDKKPSLKLHSAIESFNTQEASVNYQGKVDNTAFGLRGSKKNTDGYRENSYLHKSNINGRYSYDVTDTLSTTINVSSYTDQYGMPGPVSKEDIDSKEDRIKSNSPDDKGETSENRIIGEMEIDLGKASKINLQRGYRFRENAYILGYSSLLSEKDQTDSIEENATTSTITYQKKYTMGGLSHVFKTGSDLYESDYIRESLSENKRRNSATKNLGVFLMNQFQLSKTSKLNLGYRKNAYTGQFRTDTYEPFSSKKRWVNGETDKKEWNSDASEIGFVFSKNTSLKLVADYATSFRTPNVDEFALSENSLTPQYGKHFEIGARFDNQLDLKYALTLFQIEIKDELYYGEDPSSGQTVNRNYEEKTIRKGLEASFKWLFSDYASVWGNYTYMDAFFDSKQTKIPLVAQNTLNLNFDYYFTDDLVLVMTAEHTSERYDGNDGENNKFDKLEAYTVFNSKFTYYWRKDLKLVVGVNNAFDELYSTSAYSESHYPMPTRTLYCGVDWKL